MRGFFRPVDKNSRDTFRAFDRLRNICEGGTVQYSQYTLNYTAEGVKGVKSFKGEEKKPTEILHTGQR